jgi:hypothetical protein
MGFDFKRIENAINSIAEPMSEPVTTAPAKVTAAEKLA